jgi:ribosome-associated translation inhibitor RaiA
MRLSVSGDRVKVSPQLREYIDRHLYFALARFSSAIDHVDVRFEDMSGPRGGVAKRCRILVKLRKAGSDRITIEYNDDSLSSAVARAAARAGRTVGRSLDRRHRKRA